MPYAITSGCCNDASCVSVCPVNCIHPTPDEPDFGLTPTLYVDPRTCIDCGACADACPVDAITPADLLTGAAGMFVERNRAFYDSRPSTPAAGSPLHFPSTVPAGRGTLRIAIVGSGPAAFYTADLLLNRAGAEVTIIDRLPVAGGLLRYGVAPDHPATKQLGERFAGFLHNPRLSMLLGVEVGHDVTPAELDEHYDAVVYAVGAATGRTLDVPGTELPGCVTATDFVAWYNGHPDHLDAPAPFDHERAVIIGNGNVALDVARIVLSSPVRLERTDIADHALDALRHSGIREVVIAARRGPEHASYTAGELHDLRHHGDFDVVVADDPLTAKTIDNAPVGRQASLLQDVDQLAVDLSTAPAPGRRIVLDFGLITQQVEGADRVTGVHFDRAGDEVLCSAGLLVQAIGYHGRAIDGLPFDGASGTVPHEHGRVLDAAGAPQPGRYVVGWVKRGSSGGIGANRADAADTVESLIADAAAGRLPRAPRTSRALTAQLRRRVGAVVDKQGHLSIDAYERAGGEQSGRPRVKLTTQADLKRAAARSAKGRAQPNRRMPTPTSAADGAAT